MSDTPLYQDKIYQRQCYQSHQAEVLYVAIHSVYQHTVWTGPDFRKMDRQENVTFPG